VAALADGYGGQFAPLYDSDLGLYDKINTIATRNYRADEAIANSPVRNQLHQWEKDGYGHLPVCMAKTQYSFSTDPVLLGAPSHHVVPVREVRLAAGAGFIVAVCGDLMTMPGLPKVPSAEGMRIDARGLIEGLS
jgi:formate--tetrahydrofolate ligase